MARKKRIFKLKFHMSRFRTYLGLTVHRNYILGHSQMVLVQSVHVHAVILSWYIPTYMYAHGNDNNNMEVLSTWYGTTY